MEFQASTIPVYDTIFRLTSGAPGSAPGQNFWVKNFPLLVLGQSLSIYRILRFYDTGKCLTPYFALHQGPWICPWIAFLGFRILIFSFGTITINIPNFTLMRCREVLCTIFRPASGAPGSAPGQNFWVFKFLSLVLGQSLSIYRILRFYDTGKCFTPYFARRQGPLDPPLDRIFVFSNFNL